MRQAGATRDYHTDHPDAFRLRLFDDLSYLFDIRLGIVKLRTADEHGPVFEKILMQVRIRKRHTIRDHRDIGIAQIWCSRRDQTDLNRPLPEFRSYSAILYCLLSLFIPLHHRCPRTSMRVF